MKVPFEGTFTIAAELNDQTATLPEAARVTYVTELYHWSQPTFMSV